MKSNFKMGTETKTQNNYSFQEDKKWMELVHGHIPRPIFTFVTLKLRTVAYTHFFVLLCGCWFNISTSSQSLH